MADTLTDALTPHLMDLLGRADQALRQEGHPADPPARVLMMPGADVVHDDCCDGQLWVRITDITAHTASAGVSANQTQWGPCGINYWVASIGLGIVRCAATLDSRGNAPAPEDMTADTVLQNLDAHILAGALAETKNARLVRWTPSGPRGGCVGGEWAGQLRYGI